jgi:acetyl-CoA carboxylase alpha subunit
MQENAIYSVISPEGCAAILWRDAEFAPQAAEALRPTASQLLPLGIIDRVIEEPRGGAHLNPEVAARRVHDAIEEALTDLEQMTPRDRRLLRRERFRKLGVWGGEGLLP